MNEFLIGYGKQIISLLFLALCAYSDYKEEKIKNIIVVPGIIAGFFLNWYLFDTEGLISSIVSVGASCLFIVFYALKQMGAGDVKMLMMLSSLMNIYYCVGATIMGSIFGAAYAIIKYIQTKDKHLKVPFAVFLFFGMLVYQLLIWIFIV